MEDIQRIILVIKGHISGTIDPDQQAELEQWLEASEHNREVFARITDRRNLAGRIDFFGSYDGTHNWERISAEISQTAMMPKKRRSGRLMRYAAAVVAVAAISAGVIAMLTRNTEWSADGEVATLILPGENKAYLELADGNTVLLGQQGDLKTVEAAGLKMEETEEALVVIGPATEQASMTLSRVVVPRGGFYRIQLPDGTKVWINSESRFEFPAGFNGDNRNVTLEGEAFFEVAEDKSRPFVVRVGDMDVRVLGTSFNIEGYSDRIVTTLVSGRVRLDTPRGNYELRPGTQGISGPDGVEIRNVETARYTAWTRGMFVFENRKLDGLLESISRWYEADIVYEDERVRGLHFTFTVGMNEPLEHVLDILSETGLVGFDVKERTIRVSSK